jgi:hypothetical protein
MNACLRGAGLSLALLSFASGASAQASRTWVSGVGDDVNPCSRTAPCKTFAGAISKTAAGGEIDALDPGGYGAVTITKAITIDGGYELAGIVVAGTNGIVIQAATADVVTLRRLQINGLNGTATPGLNGVRVLSAKQVNIEDSEIFGFAGHGVDIEPTGAALTNVMIHNSKIQDNTTAGVFVGGGGRVTINSCQLTGNGYAGVDASGATNVVLVSNSNLSMNGRGIHTGAGGTVRLTHNDIVFNTLFTWEISGGVIETHQDNRTIGTGSGALTIVTY